MRLFCPAGKLGRAYRSPPVIPLVVLLRSKVALAVVPVSLVVPAVASTVPLAHFNHRFFGRPTSRRRSDVPYSWNDFGTRWQEGRNLTVKVRWAEGRPERYAEIAKRLPYCVAFRH